MISCRPRWASSLASVDAARHEPLHQREGVLARRRWRRRQWSWHLRGRIDDRRGGSARGRTILTTRRSTAHSAGLRSSAILPRRMAKTTHLADPAPGARQHRGAEPAHRPGSGLGPARLAPARDRRRCSSAGAIVVVLVLVLSFGGSPTAGVGVSANDGNAHVADGYRLPRRPRRSVRRVREPVLVAAGDLRPALGPIRATGASTPRPQPSRSSIHNLEHGGIVIWYDPERARRAESIETLTDYVESQVAIGRERPLQVHPQPVGRRRAAPGPGRGHGMALPARARDAPTSMRSTSSPRQHYGRSPEPNGGPGPPRLRPAAPRLTRPGACGIISTGA